MQEALITYGVPVALFVGLMIFKRMGQIGPGRARELIQTGARLVDVRSPGEFASGHIPGAQNIPLQELGSKASALGPKDKPIVLYCASGTRSAMARSALTRQGFKQVFNLGPMSRWQG